VATDRLFFALRPDLAAAVRIHALALRLGEVYGLTGKPLPLERLHVTLCFLGDHDGLPPQLLAMADALAKQLRSAPFELAFDRVMSFERRRDAPLVLCRDDACASLDGLRQQLGAAPGESFTPHVTLRYDPKRISLQEVAPISWQVTEVLLIRSLIGYGRHDVLERYPLSREKPRA
jgi:RNA 2',3'-cyclic 3'-phosphodiesterase